VITGPAFLPTLVNGKWIYAHPTIGDINCFITTSTQCLLTVSKFL